MKEREEELQTRREFFKKTLKTTLPILAAVAIGPLTTSCKKLFGDPDDDEGCSTCSGACKGACTGQCAASCSAACKSSCVTGCAGKNRRR